MNNEVREIYRIKEDYDDKFQDLRSDYLSKARELQEISNGKYRIENTILANRISLKDYILKSEVCELLEENNIDDYTIKDLERYLKRYDNGDLINYKLALNLYREIKEIERLEDNKIDVLFAYLKQITNIGDISNEYNKIKIDLQDKYLNTEEIDDIGYNCLIEILNDVISYYVNGHSRITNINDDALW